MSESTRSDEFNVTADISEFNASLQYVNQNMDVVIGPSLDHTTANLRLTDEYLSECEENIVDVATTWNVSRIAITSQSLLFIVRQNYASLLSSLVKLTG